MGQSAAGADVQSSATSKPAKAIFFSGIGDPLTAEISSPCDLKPSFPNVLSREWIPKGEDGPPLASCHIGGSGQVKIQKSTSLLTGSICVQAVSFILTE
jgi:hypothetical protein